ncbi:MAG: efflux RND transporter periplasmic adaptor subunit [Phyllobacterium sp.]
MPLTCVLALFLVSAAGCSDSSNKGTAPGADQSTAAPEAGFIPIHPQEVLISANVAGRVVALQTAEIRPQVGGLIQKRVFKEGSDVKEGEVLYQLDPKSYQALVTSAEASLQKAQAAETSAKAKFDRYSNLSTSQVISKQDREDAESSYLQAQADVAVAQANLQTAQINLGYATITAPIGGQISTSSVNAGSLVTASQATALATIRQLDPVYVDLAESSGNLLKFRNQLQQGKLTPLVGVGTRAEIRLTFADGTAYDEVGKIDTAEQFVSETTSTFTIRTRFDNPRRMLLPGMYVRGTVKLAVDEKGFLLPQRAVSRNAKGEATARFIKPDSTAETRVLAVSTDIGTNWLVTDGVADGDRLIVDGLQNAQDGKPVTPVEVVLNPNGTVQPVNADAAAAKASGAATERAATGSQQGAQ